MKHAETNVGVLSQVVDHTKQAETSVKHAETSAPNSMCFLYRIAFFCRCA